MAEIAITLAISAAVSAASYAINYFLTPKPKAQERGRLQGELQVQDSAYGAMIPLIYGGDPTLVGEAAATEISYVGGTIGDDFKNIDVPGTVQDDDFMLAFCHRFRGDPGEAGPSAAGWTALPGDPVTAASHGNSPAAWAFYRIASSEPASYNFAGDDDLEFFVTIEAYRGVDTSDPIADSATDSSATNGDAIDLASVTTERANSRLVGFVAAQAFLPVSPTGFSNRDDNLDDTRTLDKTEATTGATGALPFDWSASPDQYKLSYHVALNPALDSGGGSTPDGGGTTIAGNVIYLSEVRPIVTETPAEGGKGGPRTPPTKTITYYCDIGIKFCEGRQKIQKLYGDAEPLLDFTGAATTTGLVDPDADPEPDYDNFTPIDPSDPDVRTRREVRYGQSATYDSNGVLSGTLKDGSTFRFYQGTETQPADPLYESYFQGMFPTQHGAGKVVTPTLKGDCLLFIQNFNLSNFSRVPSFRAKLSNADLFSADTIIDDLALRVGLESGDLTLSAVEALPVRGLPVFNRNGAADAIAALQIIHAFDLVDANGEIEAVLRGGGIAGTVLFEDLGSVDSGDDKNDEQPIRSESEINVDLSELPARFDLTYLSTVTDGESETAGFSRLETEAKAQEAQELNAVLRKDEAERVMRRVLDMIWSEARATRRFRVPHTYYQIKPARAWTVPVSETFSERVRVTEVNGFVPGTFDCKGVVESSRSHIQTQIVVTGSASAASGIIAGHSGAPPAVTIPNTSVATFIDRILRDRELQDGRPGYYVGARGFSADPWGGCTIKRDRGAGFERIVDLTEPATLGVLATAPATLLTGSTPDIDLYEGGTLPSFTAGEVAGGQGFVIAGDLIFQYETATQLSTTPNRWQLSTLSNIGARCSTNGALAAGQRFALLNQAFRYVAVEAAEIGVARNYIAQSSGENEADCARVSFTCAAPNFIVTTPADYSLTAGNHELIHDATPFSDECVVTAGLIYEIYDDDAGNPGDLIYSGNSLPYHETGLEPGEYTRYLRAVTDYAEGAFVTDTATVLTIPGPSAFIRVPDFITHFYQGAFARDPTGIELDDETDLLVAAETSGEDYYTAAVDIGDRLFHSTEYDDRMRADEEFVTDLYRAYMARVPDEEGFDFWLTELAGTSRDHLIEAFADSPEFRLRVLNVYGWHPEESGASVEVSPAFETLTDGATVTWATGGDPVRNAVVTLGGNRTLSITGAVSGATGILIVKQDATGGRTLTLPAGSKVVGGGVGVVTLSTAANTIDVISFYYDGTNFFWTYGKNFT